MRTISPSVAFLVLLIALGCGSSEPAPEAPAAEPTAGAEQGDPAAPEPEAAEQPEAAPTPEAEAQPGVEEAMQEMQGKVIQLGVNRAALERTLEGPNVDCKRAESQRDRICSLTDEICAAAEKAPDAQPQCDNARTKCEAAKGDVKEVNCKG